MALKKCLKQQRHKLKRSQVSANHIFLLAVSKRYIDLLDNKIYFKKGRRAGMKNLAERLHRFVTFGETIKQKVHYRDGLKYFSTKGL